MTAGKWIAENCRKSSGHWISECFTEVVWMTHILDDSDFEISELKEIEAHQPLDVAEQEENSEIEIVTLVTFAR